MIFVLGLFFFPDSVPSTDYRKPKYDENLGITCMHARMLKYIVALKQKTFLFVTDLEVKWASVTKFYYHGPHSGCHTMNAQLMQPGAAGGPALATSPRWHEPLLWSQHSCLHMRMKRSNWREGGDREVGRGKGLGFCWTVVVPLEQQSSASHRVCQLDSVALTPRAAKLYPPLSSPSQLTHNITFSYSCVCVCVFLCLSYNKPFSFFLLVSWLPCFQPLCFLISTSHSSLTTHFPISANSPFLQIFLPPSLSSPLSSPLLSSPLPQQEILPETLYFKNPSNNTISTTPNKKQNKTKNKTKKQNQPTTETLDPDDAIHLYLPTQKKNYQNTQLPHPTPKNTQNKTKQNNTKTKPTHSKHKTFKQKQQQQQHQQ